SSDVDSDLSRLVYSSLFTLDSSLSLQNDLAESYEISKDSKTYTVHIKHNVQWSDGKPLTADDVVFTIQSIQNSQYASPLASSFQGVQVQKIDDYTVSFALQQTTYAPFLSNLTVGIAPKHVWESIPPKSVGLAEQELKPVGSGPYKFQELTTKKKTGEATAIKLTRNNAYYGTRPYITNIAFSFFNTHEEAISALTSGKVDGIGYLPVSLLTDVQRHPSLEIHSLLLPQYFALFFNAGKNSALGDAGVRAALALATDRTAIIQDALQNQGEFMGLPIPSGTFDFSDIKNPVFDIQKAQQNLDDAGWKLNTQDNTRTKDGKQLHVTITTTDWPEYIKTAELIQRQWKQAGIQVDINSVSTGTIQQTVVAPRDYEILLYGENLSADPDPYSFWHSSQVKSPGLNLSLLQDKDTDKYLEAARKATDTNARQEALHAFVQRFLDINPAIILYRPHYLYVSKNNVQGMGITNGALPSDRFNDVSHWYVETKRVWNKK
ncbi:MAG: peptide ABC transporter substrate-binding protein, partial [Candidatus Andersenbacteria bacterium]